MNKYIAKIISKIITLGIIVFVCYTIWDSFFGHSPAKVVKGPPNDAITYNAVVSRVIDGDTIELNLNDETITVRLIGVNAPESVHPDETKNTDEGRLAAAYTREALEGKSVELELDIQETDEYGRTLGYIWIDGQLFNKRILEDGFAELMTISPNVKYADYLKGE